MIKKNRGWFISALLIVLVTMPALTAMPRPPKPQTAQTSPQPEPSPAIPTPPPAQASVKPPRQPAGQPQSPVQATIIKDDEEAQPLTKKTRTTTPSRQTSKPATRKPTPAPASPRSTSSSSDDSSDSGSYRSGSSTASTAPAKSDAQDFSTSIKAIATADEELLSYFDSFTDDASKNANEDMVRLEKTFNLLTKTSQGARGFALTPQIIRAILNPQPINKWKSFNFKTELEKILNTTVTADSSDTLLKTEQSLSSQLVYLLNGWVPSAPAIMLPTTAPQTLEQKIRQFVTFFRTNYRTPPTTRPEAFLAGLLSNKAIFLPEPSETAATAHPKIARIKENSARCQREEDLTAEEESFFSQLDDVLALFETETRELKVASAKADTPATERTMAKEMEINEQAKEKAAAALARKNPTPATETDDEETDDEDESEALEPEGDDSETASLTDASETGDSDANDDDFE